MRITFNTNSYKFAHIDKAINADFSIKEYDKRQKSVSSIHTRKDTRNETTKESKPFYMYLKEAMDANNKKTNTDKFILSDYNTEE